MLLRLIALMPSINFFSQKIHFKLSKPNQTRKWIQGVIHSFTKTCGNINYIFCSDAYLRKINHERLKHDYYTDIITFDQSEDPKTVEAEIYVSIDRVKENSESLVVEFEMELRRVMIHGILHLLGYVDNTEEEKTAMREKEDSCLSLYRF